MNDLCTAGILPALWRAGRLRYGYDQMEVPYVIQSSFPT